MAGTAALPAPAALVIDTNVWLDLLVFDEPAVRPLDAVLARGSPCLATVAMRDELAAVLQRSRFGLDQPTRVRLLTAFDSRVRFVAAAPDCHLACSDPDDRKFLDVATAYGVGWLLSRDKALLRARRHARRRFGLQIGTPNEFLASLAAAPGGSAA